MKYKQLTQEERYQIYALIKAGNNQKQIAEELTRSPSSISRELKRNKGLKGYRPKGSPEIIIKFQLHHSHPYFSNRVALPPVRNRLVLPNNLAVAV